MKARNLTALALALQACGIRSELTEAEAVEIANTYVTTERGTDLRCCYVGRVEDDGNTIRVDYELNPDAQEERR